MRAEEAALKHAFSEFVKSREFVKYYNETNPGPWWRLLVAALALVIICTAPITVYQLIRFLQENHRRNRERNDFISGVDEMIPTFAYPVMVNRALLERPGMTAPGLVIVTFDPTVRESIDFMLGVLDAIHTVDPEGPDWAAAEEISALLSDERFTPGRRRLLPKSLTKGFPVYSLDLQIPSKALPGGRIDGPFIMCMATPGPKGRVMVCPADIAAKALNV